MDMDVTERGNFDPSKYLTKVGGKDYLEVKWRLMWLRDVHPDAVIDTQLVDREPWLNTKTSELFPCATFKATVTIPGKGAATGYGSESVNHFESYLEKAESKALGRALAVLGFGTQFAGDLDEGERVVDAPVRRPAPKPVPATVDTVVKVENGNGGDDAEHPITPAALAKIKGEAAKQGWNEAAVETECKRRFGKGLTDLSTGEGRTLYRWAASPRSIAS